MLGWLVGWLAGWLAGSAVSPGRSSSSVLPLLLLSILLARSLARRLARAALSVPAAGHGERLHDKDTGGKAIVRRRGRANAVLRAKDDPSAAYWEDSETRRRVPLPPERGALGEYERWK